MAAAATVSSEEMLSDQNNIRYQSIQDILPLVEKPSRYLGTEVNTVHKDPRSVKLRMALAFPDLYEIGSSHFGLQILYHLLNREPEILAERVFAPAVDMEAHLRASGLALVSLESRTPLDRFDIIGFSLLYELNYSNVVNMLSLCGLPFFAAQRTDEEPLIIAGGPCTCNPEPVADFFDAMVIGDGEQVVPRMAQVWLAWQNGGPSSRQSLLEQWARLPGVYVPSFYDVHYDPDGFERVTPVRRDLGTVERAVVEDLDRVPFPDAPIVPFGRPVHDRLRLEVARGCSRGCRFCQAGMLYRPVRERSAANLLALSEAALAATGYEDLSLLSLSTGDYHCLEQLMEYLMARCQAQHVAVSFPSLRAGTLSPRMMDMVKRVRKTGFTIAAEAGTQRLRDVINKNISEQDIVTTVEDAFALGWQVIKLYFMVGLPTETDADLKGIVQLVERLRHIKGPFGRRGKINVSVATFIPKPHTPFQWSAQIGLDEARRKIDWLKGQLQRPGIQFKWQPPQVSLLEGLWSRGDRRLSHLLVAAHHHGCKFDGWSDHFNFSAWQTAIAESRIDPDFYTLRPRGLNEPLPWDHIDLKIDKDYLQEEWRRARQGQLTADCRWGECAGCGVCDFKQLAPKVFERCDVKLGSHELRAEAAPSHYQRLAVVYEKLGPARFFGHLELVNIFLRAMRRAGLALKYSQGFHPMPKVAFDQPLPVGIESRHERLVMTVTDQVHPSTVVPALNAHLPEGLRALACQPASPRPAASSATYTVCLQHGHFDPQRLAQFAQKAHLLITRTTKKGREKSLDLKRAVRAVQLLDERRLQLTLSCEPGQTVRPPEALRHIFGMPEPQIRQARIVKGAPQ